MLIQWRSPCTSTRKKSCMKKVLLLHVYEWLHFISLWSEQQLLLNVRYAAGFFCCKYHCATMCNGKTRTKWQTTLSWPRLNFDSNTLKDHQTNGLQSKIVAQYQTILIKNYAVSFCSNIFKKTMSQFSLTLYSLFPVYIRVAYTPLNINICIHRVIYSLRLYYIYDMQIYMLNVLKASCCWEYTV